MSTKIEWPEAWLASLRQLRDEGHSMVYCAYEIGVCYETLVLKARELGLAGRRNRGRTPGTAVVAEARKRTRPPDG
jgi:hypothetical protein